MRPDTISDFSVSPPTNPQLVIATYYNATSRTVNHHAYRLTKMLEEISSRVSGGAQQAHSIMKRKSEPTVSGDLYIVPYGHVSPIKTTIWVAGTARFRYDVAILATPLIDTEREFSCQIRHISLKVAFLVCLGWDKADNFQATASSSGL
jgi:hypothetical protein